MAALPIHGMRTGWAYRRLALSFTGFIVYRPKDFGTIKLFLPTEIVSFTVKILLFTGIDMFPANFVFQIF